MFRVWRLVLPYTRTPVSQHETKSGLLMPWFEARPQCVPKISRQARFLLSHYGDSYPPIIHYIKRTCGLKIAVWMRLLVQQYRYQNWTKSFVIRLIGQWKDRMFIELLIVSSRQVDVVTPSHMKYVCTRHFRNPRPLHGDMFSSDITPGWSGANSIYTATFLSLYVYMTGHVISVL